MKCRQVKRQLGAYVEGFLPEYERGRLEGHLATCDDCRRHLMQVKTLVERLADDQVGASETLVPRIMAHVRASEIHPEWSWRCLLENSWPTVAIAALLAMALAMIQALFPSWSHFMNGTTGTWGSITDWGIAAATIVLTGLAVWLANWFADWAP